MPVLIDTATELEALVRSLRDEPELALDVEGDGLFRYRPRLCTIQLATRDRVVLLDTLALPELAPLAPLLGASGPRKLLHDALFDTRMLAEVGLVLDGVTDTSVAARFLGEPQTGLAALALKHLGVTIEKELQQADWGKRPIDANSLTYLENDVKHLGPLADVLRAEVVRLGIEEEVAEETRYVLSRATDEQPVTPPWTRISGAQELGAISRAVLRAVADVREAAAERLDVPPFKVIGNAQLLQIATRRPRSAAELRAIPGALSGRARALGGELLDAVRAAEALGDVPPEELRHLVRPSVAPDERARVKRRHEALSAWRKQTAAARGVDVQVVLPGHCLSDLAAHHASSLEDLRAVRGFGEVRVARDGQDVLGVLRTADAGTLPRA